MRLLWASGAPWGARTSSYSAQTALILPRLAALGHDVALLAWFGLEGGILETTLTHAGEAYPLRVYPQGADRYGNDVVAECAADWRADLTISCVDGWVLDGAAYSTSAPWAAYYPVDCWPLPPGVAETMKTHAAVSIVPSQFAVKQCADAGITARHIPYMLDDATFAPGDRASARRALGWPADGFTIAMVAANRGFPSRKAIPEALKAFALFAKRHRDAYLYLHTGRGGTEDVNVPQLIGQLGLAGRVQLPSAAAYRAGLSGAELANVYRAANVLLAPSYGEGLCLPVLEAQACGTPAIVSGWSGVAEICFDGYTIPMPGVSVSGYGFIPQDYLLPHGGNHAIPMIGEIVRALEWAYSLKDTPDRQAKRRAAVAPYAADTVAAECWAPLLRELSQ